MLVDKISFPALLLGTDNTIEVVSNSEQLTFVTKLTVREKSLKGCIIYDNEGDSFIVLDMIEVAKVYPWWRFEFFNPMIEVRLEIERKPQELQTIKETIALSISLYRQYWEDQEDIDVIKGKIFDADSLHQIISYLKRLKGIL